MLGSGWTSGLISVGIGLESGGVNDSLVVHQLVALVVREGEELVGFGVSDDLVSFDDLGLARLVLRVLDFVEHVLAHDVIVQLGFTLAVGHTLLEILLERIHWCFRDHDRKMLSLWIANGGHLLPRNQHVWNFLQPSAGQWGGPLP